MQIRPALRPTETLTAAELELLQDTRFCALRQSAMQKVEHQLMGVQEALEQWLTEHPGLPALVYSLKGRISRGEQYKDVNGLPLPYRVLDCPRLFSDELTLAYRVVFVWGQGWSQHLLLSGLASEPLREQLLTSDFICKNIELDLRPTPWRLEPSGLLLQEAHNRQQAAHHPFLKLSRYQPLTNPDWQTTAIGWWNELGAKLLR